MPSTNPSSEFGERAGRRRRRSIVGGILLGLAGLITLIVVDVVGSQGDRGAAPPAAGPMGGAVVDIPIEASGTAAAGGVEVVGSSLAMGRVPLDVTVIPTWRLANTGSETVQIGQPHASVVEGCCPGPFAVETAVLEPGDSTELVFPLQMHRGMDGPHHFTIHVPIGAAGDVLELEVTGDFRD